MTTLRCYILFALICCYANNDVFAQFYLTGTTLADSTQRLPFARMLLHSNGILYNSGSQGDFGIPSRNRTDTITCWYDGFDTIRQVVFHGTTNIIRLHPTVEKRKLDIEKGRLSNLIANYKNEDFPYHSSTGESYPTLVQNQMVKTRDYPVTGLSPTTNKASYANIRRFIKGESRVNPNAVRIEEMVNYFSLACAPAPTGGATFSLESRITDCPWNPKAKLIVINSVARSLDFSRVPPANLVFLIDNSGSMDMPNRLPLLKSAFSMLVKSLRDIDRVAIVTYGGMAGIHLPPTTGIYKDSILAAINALEAGGATSGSSGIHLAYQLAIVNPIPGANNRVILATDGDFNVGLVSEKELEDMIIMHQKTGVKLTCLGVGMGNLKDSKIETLARHGNGTYAYLDDEQEAEKTMVHELTQNLYSVATNVTLHFSLNPDIIKSYKIIGFENRLGAVQSAHAHLVGGEIGSGFAMNAMLEIVLSDSSNAFITKNYNKSLGKVTLKYHDIRGPLQSDSMISKDIVLNYLPISETERNIRLVAGIAYFGLLLKHKDFQTPKDFERLQLLTKDSINPQNPKQVELGEMIEQIKKMYIIEKKPAPKPSMQLFRKNKS
jgi:Ca-activated chloride channel homolog